MKQSRWVKRNAINGQIPRLRHYISKVVCLTV